MDLSVFAKHGSHPVIEVIFGAVVVTSLLLVAGSAYAAPQSLGLVTTAQPVPMICDDRGCVAQLSSFCLQKERKTPSYSTPYRVAEGAELWLQLTDADGGQWRVPAKGVARLVSSRGYSAIEASVSTTDRIALGAVAISVVVGDLVTLFPEPDPADPSPITAAEAAFVKGPARRVAEGIFDSSMGLGDTINILDRAINSTTTFARLSDEGRRDLWLRVTGRPLEADIDNGTRDAAAVFSACLDDLRRQAVFGLRNCLEGRRDALLIRANLEFWNRLATGS